MRKTQSLQHEEQVVETVIKYWRRHGKVKPVRSCINISERRKVKRLDMWNKTRIRKVGHGLYVNKKGERWKFVENGEPKACRYRTTKHVHSCERENH
jgi:hypothetical protein